jgi:hypothetical protein
MATFTNHNMSRASKENLLHNRIDRLIDLTTLATQSSNPYVYLPEIIVTLDTMRDRLERGATDSRSRARLAGTLRTLVDRSHAFSSSALGSMLLDLAADFVFDWGIHEI